MISKLIEIVKDLNNIIYRPNTGNIGDALICYSTIQLFNKESILFKTMHNKEIEDKKFDFVYGGGGIFHPNYYRSECFQQAYIKYFINKNVNKIVILPSTFYQVDDLIRKFDNRYIVFCREKRSFDYIKSVNENIECYLCDDIATFFNIDNLNLSNDVNKNLKEKYNLVLNYKKDNPDEAYFMRNDSEKRFRLNKESIDISSFGGIWGEDILYDSLENFVHFFFKCINLYDIIHTDRLHVCIAANLLNKKVYFYNNSYGKNKAVYNFTLNKYKNIEFYEN